MDQALWTRVKEVVGEALDLEPSARPGFLDAACAGDSSLRTEVDKLLRADDGAGHEFLDPPSLNLDRVENGGGCHNEPGSLVGTDVGRYRVRRLIGAGGMGAVYEAVQDQPRRVVALKVMRAGITSRSSLRRFEYESQMLARLRHPGVAQVYDAGTHQSDLGAVPFFAMEYIQGAKTLTDYAASRGLGLREKLALFAAICDAVHHGHQKGIIHRDIKPSNILVDSSGHAKIIDFGVARATDSDVAATTVQTDVGQLVGTLQYMSPEQCAGDHGDIDTRSDVYSLGIVLYELLTSKLPYTVNSTALPEAARMIREETPPRLSTINRTLRGDVETITLKALEKDRDRRYQSAAELGKDIERYLANQPIVARPPSVAYQVRIFARRHKVLIAAAAIVFATLCAGVIGTGIGLVRAVAERESARKSAVSARDSARRSLMVANFLKQTLAAAAPGAPAIDVKVDASDFYLPWDTLRPQQDLPPRSSGPPTIIGLLSEAGERARTGFVNEPLVRAEVESLIGQALAQQGDAVQGRAILARARATQKTILGLADDNTIRTCIEYAGMCGVLSDRSEGEAALRDAVEGSTRLYGEWDPRTRHVSRSLSYTIGQDALRRPQAITAQRGVIRELSAMRGVNDPLVLVEICHLANLLLMDGQLDESESLARESYKRLRQEVGDQHRATADAAFVLVEALRLRGGRARFEESEALHRMISAFYLGRFGPDSDALNETRKSHVIILWALERWDEAERAARAMYDSNRRTYGPNHLQTIKSAARLARVLIAAGDKLDEAHELSTSVLGTILDNDEEDYAVYHSATAAQSELSLGRVGEAETLIQKLYHRAHARTTRPNAPWVMGYLHQVLGEVRMAQGRLPEAEGILVEGLKAIDQWKDPSHPVRVSILWDLATIADRSGASGHANAWRSLLPTAAEDSGKH